MSVYERVQAIGEFEVNLVDAVPKSVLDYANPFTHIVIMRGPVYANRLSDSAILDGALYTGVVLEPAGTDKKISGAGLGWWLGDANNQGAILTANVNSSGQSLSAWVSALKPASLASGTVTSPGGTVGGSYQWVTARQALDGICAGFGVEWRVRPNFKLDVMTAANHYGSTPTVIAHPQDGGSGASGALVGLEAEFTTKNDFREYASLVYVQGQGGRGSSGGTSPYRDGQGNLATITRVLDAQNTAPGSESATAANVVNLWSSSSGQRQVDVTANRFAVTSVLPCGAPLYLYDSENGLYATGAPIRHDGRAVFPATTRVLGVRWPIVKGMGVMARTWNGSGYSYTDLTPYVDWETGATKLEIT